MSSTRKTSNCCKILLISFDAFLLQLRVLQEWLQLTLSSIRCTFVSLSLINFQWKWITSETCCKRMLQETPPKGAVFFWVVKSIFKIALLLLLPPLPLGRLSWGHGRCTYRISLPSPSQRKTPLFRQPVLVCFAASLSILSKNFSSCDKFSMGFNSGLSGGVRHQFISFSSLKKALARLDVCLGSLSCINLWSGSVWLMNGRRVVSRSTVLQYSSAPIIPSKMHTLVASFRLIPAHTCTLSGCLGFGFLFNGSSTFR